MAKSKKVESEINSVFPAGFFKQFKSQEEFGVFFKDLFRQGIEEMLQGEMDEHLGYEKHSILGYNSGNSRNGSYPKTIKSESIGDMVLNIPRDRQGEFESHILPKGKTISNDLENAIIGMYSRGMSTTDITHQLEQIYGIKLSNTTISNITDRIINHAIAWQNRPLEQQYLIVWLDGIKIKIRDNGKVISKCIYIVLGLNNEGIREVLGIWIDISESASFWLSVLSDLKARGVEDILIACTDNLTGFESAINTVFPNAVNQLCVIHQIRNCCKFVVWKDMKEFCADMKKIYGAINRKQAENELIEFQNKWGNKYKYAIESWKRNWDRLTQFFDFPAEIRKIMYTTNIIENLNRGIRKYTKTKYQFPNDDAAFKAVFLAVNNIENRNQRSIQNWGLIYNQFSIIFEGRIRF